MNAAPECVWPVGAVLGEGPVWCAGRGELWFVDIKGRRLHCLGEDGSRRSFDTPDLAAFLFPTTAGGFLCGLKPGLHAFDPQQGRFTLLQAVDADLPSNRLNDGCVDAGGRLWFGTMDNDEASASGSLYRYDGRTLERMDSGYVITNGPAFSPDGRTLYHVDTFNQRVLAFDVDAGGAIGNRRLFVQIEEEGVYPDGPVVDALGRVWLGLFGGWGVACYSPEGRLLHRVKLPVARCTKVAFGGADLRTLYITTARVGLTGEELAGQPLAGGLFRLRVDAPGLPQPLFRMP
jgi:D-xylonolactonase|nr:MAG: gluconolaconase [Pseudomonadota bacterium]